LNNDYRIKEVTIQKVGLVKLDPKKKTVSLNEANLKVLNKSFQAILKKNRGELDQVLQNSMHQMFPKLVGKPAAMKYSADDLANSLNRWGNSINEFSKGDKEAIKDLFDKLSMDTDFLTSQSLSKTKEIVDNKYIATTLKKFKELMKKPTTEKRWQKFIKDNSWIFSSLFAQPVILFKDEAYVGGKTVDNSDGKFNDFLIKNSLSDNVSFLEIKTHKTELLEKSPYRGTDVFSASKELTGCIVQVLNQRDNFQKEFYQFKGKGSVGGNFETINSKCLVLAGSTKGLKKNQKASFELFRTNSRDVEILTFDELEHKIDSLQKILLKK
jgi:hypothetical protein